MGMALSTRPLEMSEAGLDELYGSSPAGEIPAGRGRGTVIAKAGTRFTRPLAAATRVVLWQGKLFRPVTHDLVNLMTPFGREAIRAEVSHGESVLDGRPCIVLDYSKTSRAARKIRDEIRQIGPNEYLGIVFKGSRKMHVHFVLHFDSDEPSGAASAS